MFLKKIRMLRREGGNIGARVAANLGHMLNQFSLFEAQMYSSFSFFL